MHLSKTDIEVGKKNYQEASEDFSRRDFLKGGVAAGVVGGVGLGATYFGYGRTVENPVRIGVIGTGDEGNVLMGAINPDFVQVVAIADIRPYNIYRAFHGDESGAFAQKMRPGLLAKYGWPDETIARQTVNVYENGYEELLDDPNVEGVIIALPLHLHAEASIKAMRKGKHVLCEKLMGHDVAECKEMGRVAADTNKLLAVGHQRHYSILYDNAAQSIKRGLIGDIHHIRAQWHRGNLPGSDSWQQDLPYDPKLAKPSDTKIKKEVKKYTKKLADHEEYILDRLKQGKPIDSGKVARRTAVAKNLRVRVAKLKDAALAKNTKFLAELGYKGFTVENAAGDKYEVSPIEELIRWRLWNRTGGGLMAELGSHQLDAASIFVSALRDDGKKVHPLTVTGVGGRHIFPLDREADDHVYCAFEFPSPEHDKDPNKKIVVSYSSINGNGFGGYGETVMGTGGTLTVHKEADVLLYPAGGAKTSVTAAKGGGPTLDTTQSGGDVAAQKQATGPVSRGYTEEIEHWAWCIRNRAPENKPRCHPEIGLADATIALTSNRAIRENQRITFEEDWFKIDSDATPEGNKPNTAQERYKV